MMGKEQEQRLMGLLQKLSDANPGDALHRDPFGRVEFDGQEHRDARTLVHLGWIRHKHQFTDITNSWSAEGIYAFNLTEDGRAALGAWKLGLSDEVSSSDDARTQRHRPMVMVIHGSRDGCVPRVVDDIRLWCFEQGLDAYKAADLPNSGRFVNDKVNSTIDDADYYVVVLTADDELANGRFHPRLNAVIEMGRVLDRNPALVCVLKENKVDMPSDYTGLVTEPLENWSSVLQRELKEAGLL